MRTPEGEPIEMVARRYGYLPASFRWRGQRFDVLDVEKCSIVRGKRPRRLFQVRCAAGNFRLEQALGSNTWQATAWPPRLRLVLHQPAATPRYPLPRNQRRTRAQAGWAAQVASRQSPQDPQAGARSRTWILGPQRP